MRFPDFEGEWGKKKLGEIGEVISGLTYSPNDISDDGVLVLRSSNVKNRMLAFEDNVFVKTENYNPVLENDILICVRNGSQNLIGKNALIKKENEGYAFGAFMTVYRSNYNKFLFHWFDTKEYKSEVYKNLGATINSINGGDLRRFKIPFPSKAEQDKIALFLSLLDDRIATQSKIINKLETLMQGIREKVFTQNLRFKDEKGREFPAWTNTTIGNIATVNAGATPNTFRYEYWDGDIRWMNSGELNLKKVYEVENRITELGLKESSTKLLPKYCVLIGLAGQGKTRGTVAMNFVELCTNQSIAAILPNENVFNSEYVYHNLDNRYDELRALSTGDGGRGGLNLQIIKSMIVALPSIQEQAKIANFLSGIDEKTRLERRILAQYNSVKKYLLQNVFI